VRDKTTWVHIDLNYAPLVEADAYQWLANEIIQELRRIHPSTDFDDIETIQKVYAVEVLRLRKGPLSVLDPTSTEYKTRWVDAITDMQRDRLLTAKSMIRFLCGERSKLPVIVLDNCDKRTRDEQLLMFQLAQWAQRELKSLIFLPIRDVTYDHHRSEPPLDTALKDLVFRIEPPQFAKVLQQRVKLALTEMTNSKASRTLSYDLPNGFRVEYPRSDQGMYLASILRSLYEYDRLIRRTITGLAGRDIRRAMEIFLEFCTSGHIGEHEIFMIRQSEGAHPLPYEVVVRVLLRMNRRFYEGDQSYIRNLFSCNPADPRPDMFCRLAMLTWLRSAWPVKGPTGVKGYHQVLKMIKELVPAGHDANVIRRELLYLIQSDCVLAEHQRTDRVDDDDLVCLAPAGAVHLDLTRNCDYLAACSEDTWYDEAPIAHTIAARIGTSSSEAHYSRATTMANANDFVSYLRQATTASFPCPSLFLKHPIIPEIEAIEESGRSVNRELHVQGVDLFVKNLPWGVDAPQLEIFFKRHVFVLSARVAKDNTTGRSKGWGIVRVRFGDENGAIQALHQQVLDGRRIFVRKWDPNAAARRE
jgi:hypothetical protein